MQTALVLILQYKYLILFPIAVFEGPVISLVVGFLISTNTLELVPAYLIMISADLIPDTVCYFIGHYSNKSTLITKLFNNPKFGLGNVDVIGKLWKHHYKKTIFLTKLAYGLSTPLLISAGFFKVDFKKFISYIIPIALVEHVVLITIGYYLGFSYFSAIRYVKYFGIIVGILFIGFIGIYFWLAKYFQKQFIKAEELEVLHKDI